MRDFKELVELCRGHKIFIQTHNFPDADALSSALGLQKLLEHYEIESSICAAGAIDRKNIAQMVKTFGIKVLSQEDILDVMNPEDYIICVDSQKLAGNITDFVGNEVAAIDHHPTFVEVKYKYAELCITGACATLITHYYMQTGVKMSRTVATALLYGLKMDTLQFSRGVTIMDVEAFGYLLPLANMNKIERLMKNTMEFRDLGAYGAAIENIRVFQTVGFAYVPFTCPDGLIGSLSDFILALDEVDVSIVFSKRKDGYKFSVRSELDEVHAGDLIHEALSDIGNGGGHASMAGGFVPSVNVKDYGDFLEQKIWEHFIKVLNEKMLEYPIIENF
ncbi:MAG: DHHA1 domain-containing protein [Lachnospiraceae bacterium]|nr:DHHA1 domain-containing protein [Lachnospiraceae bacterium]